MAELRLRQKQASGLGPRASGLGLRASGFGAAVVAVAVAACGRADAVPPAPVTPPAGWIALPDVAKAVGVALDGNVVASNLAWGDTARGCYASYVALTAAAAAPDALAKQITEELRAEPGLAGITITNVVEPAAAADTGVLSLSFERPPYHGKLRAQLAKTGAIDALACFWNAREPIACESTCTSLVGGMK